MRSLCLASQYATTVFYGQSSDFLDSPLSSPQAHTPTAPGAKGARDGGEDHDVGERPGDAREAAGAGGAAGQGNGETQVGGAEG